MEEGGVEGSTRLGLGGRPYWDPEAGADRPFVGVVSADERLAHVTANTGHRVVTPSPGAAVLWPLGFEFSDGAMVWGKEDRSLQRARWRPLLSGPVGYEWRGDFPRLDVFVYLIRIDGGDTVAACVAAIRRIGLDATRGAWERPLKEAAADGLPTPLVRRGDYPQRPWLLTALHPDVINDNAAVCGFGIGRGEWRGAIRRGSASTTDTGGGNRAVAARLRTSVCAARAVKVSPPSHPYLLWTSDPCRYEAHRISGTTEEPLPQVGLRFRGTRWTHRILLAGRARAGWLRGQQAGRA